MLNIFACFRAADSLRGRLQDTKKITTLSPAKGTPQAFQMKMGFKRNLSNRCVRSESPPNSSTVRTNTRRGPHLRSGEASSLHEKTLSRAPKMGPVNNCDGFYQFFA